MSFSNYLENKILDHVYGGTAYSAPTTVYIELFTTAPNAETGASGVAVSGGSYARAAVTNDGSNLEASGSTVTNASAITFATPTASWGTVVAFGIYDASTGGNLLNSANLTTSKTINSGDTVRFDAGSLTITLD